jgi:hypothetical protein
MPTSIKITELTNIGASIAYTTLVPVVNMAGTPITEKANLQILGNLILSGAGGANYVAANQATTAGTVTTAAQPNITSTGTLTTLIVTGAVKTSSTTFSGLGSASTAGAGARSFITDANLVVTGNFGATIAGSGGNSVPVYSDGTNWKIG